MEVVRKLMEDSNGKPDLFYHEDMEYPTWLDLAKKMVEKASKATSLQAF